ncbi:hypothetical protein [Metabacillus arenae]|uniref:Uncharacterized protein n=1 Tax=Metabacillus arenae TaxID=2771434 RepID=A0A926RYD5_9BACI|nr:hypothetical protein [Metabacillus arenae]MBD1381620.1 hypothetical protein [Metabacillus arenae]
MYRCILPTAGPRAYSFDRLYQKPVNCNSILPWEFERLATENGWCILEGQGVYNSRVDQLFQARSQPELKQAISFLWLFMLENEKEEPYI